MPLELFLGVEFEKQLEWAWYCITHESNGPSNCCIDGHDILVCYERERMDKYFERKLLLAAFKYVNREINALVNYKWERINRFMIIS